MDDNSVIKNYKTALDDLAVGYNKTSILNSITFNAMELLDAMMSRIERNFDPIVEGTESLRAGHADTAQNAESIDSIMKRILEKNASMNESIQKRMDEIEEAVAEANSIADLFSSLRKKTQNVAGFTDSIRDVSQRTSVLAINASIEAARAGKVGGGFRIIANEVRNLADQTEAFALQIDENLKEFLAAVNQLNKQMSDFMPLFARFKKEFTAILENFTDNSKTIAAAGSSLSGISASLNEETASISNMLSSLERIDGIMYETHAVLAAIQTSQLSLNSLLGKTITL